MKKTIIALLALAGVTMADSVTISNAGNTAAATGDWFSTLTADSEITIASGSAAGSTGYTGDFYTVATNIGNGGSYTYTLTFSLKDDISLSALNVDFFLHDSAGKSQAAYNYDGQVREVSYALTLGSAGSTPLFSTTATNLTDWEGTNNNSGGNHGLTSAYDSITGSFTTNAQACTINLTTEDITLSKGTTYSLTIDVAKGNANVGTYVGIGNIKMSGVVASPAVPEPTMATLSLLALAGLAARRRRR